MKKFVSIKDMQKIGDWARTYTWNLVFQKGDKCDGSVPEPPSMFGDWFPAIDVTITQSGLDTQSFVGGIIPFSIPLMSVPLSLSVTFLDEHTLSVSQWLSKYASAVANRKEGYVLPLKDASYDCTVVFFDSEEGNVKTGKYTIIPNYSLALDRNSSGEIVQQQVDFHIVGIDQDIFSGGGGGGGYSPQLNGHGTPRGAIHNEESSQ